MIGWRASVNVRDWDTFGGTLVRCIEHPSKIIGAFHTAGAQRTRHHCCTQKVMWDSKNIVEEASVSGHWEIIRLCRQKLKILQLEIVQKWTCVTHPGSHTGTPQSTPCHSRRPLAVGHSHVLSVVQSQGILVVFKKSLHIRSHLMRNKIRKYTCKKNRRSVPTSSADIIVLTHLLTLTRTEKKTERCTKKKRLNKQKNGTYKQSRYRRFDTPGHTELFRNSDHCNQACNCTHSAVWSFV
jgi:hypothetical protein